MTAELLERPAEPTAVNGGAPARRAVVRWAWRLFRREWRQQLLVLALLTVAVAATILGAAVGTNTPPPANAGYGNADHLVTLPGSDPHLAADIAAMKQSFGTVDVIENQAIATGLVQGAQLRAQDPNGRFGGPMLALVSGRYPVSPDEVAMTKELASTFNLRVGAVWRESGHALRVVGLVENPQNLLDDFALVPPGQVASPTQVTVLFNATPERAASGLPSGVSAQTPAASQGIDPAIIVFVLTIFGLIFVGLVSVAGFSVLAQRRLRALGMLSSLGATYRNVRLVMVANGAVVGVVATLIGTVLGFAAWIAYAPNLQRSAHHRVAWTHLPWWLVAATMVLAVVTSILAARRPARTAARLPVVAALSGRPAVPKPRHRTAVPGMALLVIGLALLAFSGGWGSSNGREALFQVGGLLAVAIGLLLLASVCVTLLGVLARRAPVAVRLALRDLARYRARSGAALAAISLAVLIAMVICLLATGRYADPVDYFGPNLPANQLVVYAPGTGPGSHGPDSGAAGAPRSPAGLQAVANSIASSLDSHDVLGLDSTGAMLGQVASATVGGVVGQAVRVYPGTVYVATPELLRHYGIDPGAIDPTALLVTSRAGLAGTGSLELFTSEGPVDGCAAGRCAAHPKIQTLGGLPTDTSDPNLLVTSHAVDTLKLSVTRVAWLIQTPQPLSAAQINTARQAASAEGMTIETKNQDPSLAQLRNYATAAGILLALAVLAMTVGLIRSETAGDLQTLTATGASGSTRRNVTAATAGALGLFGALLGTAVAYLTAIAFFRSQLSERMSEVPILDITLIVVGLPVIATIGSWLVAGREPRVIAHRPIE
ncbi:MAG: putative transport system permease protein [Micromonosporaceae bacterium]